MRISLAKANIFANELLRVFFFVCGKSLTSLILVEELQATKEISDKIKTNAISSVTSLFMTTPKGFLFLCVRAKEALELQFLLLTTHKNDDDDIYLVDIFPFCSLFLIYAAIYTSTVFCIYLVYLWPKITFQACK